MKEREINISGCNPTIDRKVSGTPVDPKYANAEYKTHSRGKVKNKYRNMACPCGSGKKFKKCCIGKVD